MVGQSGPLFKTMHLGLPSYAAPNGAKIGVAIYYKYVAPTALAAVLHRQVH